MRSTMTASMAALQLCTSNLADLHKSSSSAKPRKVSSRNLREPLFLNRRTTMATTLSTTLLSLLHPHAASAFDFRLTVPDQTVEEAEAVIRSHAQGLLRIKSLLEAESWREAQSALRRSSAYLKQDLYTIIQAKPGDQRPPLRGLYSNLFNNVSKLDYAARRKDANVVKECYDNIVSTLGEIFAKI